MEVEYPARKRTFMTDLSHQLSGLLVKHLGLGEKMAGFLSIIVSLAAIIGAAILLNWLCQKLFSWIGGKSGRFIKTKWHSFIIKHRIGHRILLLIPGFAIYIMLDLAFEKGNMLSIFRRIDVVYMIWVITMIGNGAMMAFLDIYNTTDKNRRHPLQGLVQGIQVVLFFVAAIFSTAVLIDKSLTTLFAGLGASAAVLMLVFKDSILGFVAGVQLTQNDMIKLGDWIQMPDGTANGNVMEITLNTVKVRNWDNTISMIPPYTLVTTSFKNWRGMQESGGRRVDKMIYLDIRSLEFCTPDMVDDICKALPLLNSHIQNLRASGVAPGSDPHIGMPGNSQLYRIYIEQYLRQHPLVNQELDIIVAQREMTQYGLPIEVYFFLKNKTWAVYEREQSDIFDHLVIILHEFGLRLYQLPQ